MLTMATAFGGLDSQETNNSKDAKNTQYANRLLTEGPVIYKPHVKAFWDKCGDYAYWGWTGGNPLNAAVELTLRCARSKWIRRTNWLNEHKNHVRAVGAAVVVGSALIRTYRGYKPEIRIITAMRPAFHALWDWKRLLASAVCFFVT